MFCCQVSRPLRVHFRTPRLLRSFSFAPLQLPWIKSYNPEFKHPAFLVHTEVRTSDCDGYGRFAMEFIPKFTKIAHFPLIYAKDIQASNMDISDDLCILFENKRDVEYVIERYSSETNVSREDLETGIGHFMASFAEDVCHISSCSACLNHMPKNNIKGSYDFSCKTNGKSVQVHSLCDIQAGEELFENYETFSSPQWFMDWCLEHQIVNVNVWLKSYVQ